MKQRIIFALAALLVLGLAIVVFAYNKTDNSSRHAAMSCCCKDGSCPMKNKDAAATADMQKCCDNPDCCCKTGSESCPMKTQGEATQSVDTQDATVVKSDEHCNMACCKHKKQS